VNKVVHAAKRHLLVDTLGLVLLVMITAAMCGIGTQRTIY
jgi:transposase